ncbi:MAG: hypothetical protein ACU0CN_09380 [Pseudooceanicola nanhaiensis]|uniref:hypothetical protein n=1 Tax=Pseudooceanicola nanhaiensis TaxID=375761 RepID=UPI0040586EF3
MLRLCLTLICLCAAAPALPGAWPRGAGQGFAALAARVADGTLPSEPSYRGSLYLDYGVTPRSGLTLELDTARGRVVKALGFYRMSLLPPQGAWQIDAALGAGRVDGVAVVSPRLTLGRSFRLRGAPGWAEAMLGAEITRTDQAGKIDLTLGLAPTPRMRSYVQLFAYRARGGTLHLRGESSLAVRLTNRLWFDTGLSTGITPDRDYRLKLGIWTEF